ncbi:MAG: STAS domain-containing protein [Candidatus Kapabacteria bacterium]|nr:STAS domain-containing protein [Candidatus Kapabacteria bacterium]
MTITQHTADTVSVALAENVLGGADAAEFSKHIQSLAEQGVRRVLVDMSAVRVMNSSGLGMLVAAHSTLRKFGGAVDFAAVPEKVTSLLAMTHLNTVFKSYASVDEALVQQDS